MSCDHQLQGDNEYMDGFMLAKAALKRIQYVPGARRSRPAFSSVHEL